MTRTTLQSVRDSLDPDLEPLDDDLDALTYDPDLLSVLGESLEEDVMSEECCCIVECAATGYCKCEAGVCLCDEECCRDTECRCATTCVPA